MNTPTNTKATQKATQVALEQLRKLAAATTVSTQKRALSFNQASLKEKTASDALPLDTSNITQAKAPKSPFIFKSLETVKEDGSSNLLHKLQMDKLQKEAASMATKGLLIKTFLRH